MEKFLGIWVVDASKDENVDAFEEAEGMPQQVREAIKNAKRIIKDNGDGTYTLGLDFGDTTRSTVVTLGVPFESTRPNGDKAKMTITLEGDAMVDQIENLTKGKSVHVTSKREGDLLVSVFKGDSGQTAKRYFKK